MTAPLTPAQIAAWRATHMLAAHAQEIADSHDRLTVAQRVVTCVYCGHQYAEGTPVAQHAALTEHIATCEKHPLRAARAECERLRAALNAIAFEPIADPEDSDARCYDIIVEIARAALATPGSSAGVES